MILINSRMEDQAFFKTGIDDFDYIKHLQKYENE
jgi:hypothetical protein